VFSVLANSESFACTFEPKTIAVQIPLDSQNKPTQSPPKLDFQVKLTAPGKVTEIVQPETNAFAYVGSPAFPSASGAAFSYSGNFVIPRTSTFIAKVSDSTGLTRTCNLDVVVTNAPGSPSNSPFAFRGDVTGDGVEDVLTFDKSTGILWVDTSINVVLPLSLAGRVIFQKFLSGA
jgi:hypothetical protein